MKARKSRAPAATKKTPAGSSIPVAPAESSDRLLRFGAMGKAFTILETITSTDQPLSMAEIARETGMTKPTAHRVISLLAEIGFLERDPTGRGYTEGGRLIDFALSTLRAASHRVQRSSILHGLSERVSETCNFGVLSGSEVIYLDRVEAKWPLGLRFEPGSRVPAHCTAIGKLLLSLQDESDRDGLLAALPLTRYTTDTLTDREALREDLVRTRKSRVGTDDQEFMSGVVCVAVPVVTESGDLIGGIAVSAPEARITLDEARGFVPEMRLAAARLGATFKTSTKSN